MTMTKGSSGMGMHKHGISGYSPRSPRYKLTRLLDDIRIKATKPKRPKSKMYNDIKDLFKETK